MGIRAGGFERVSRSVLLVTQAFPPASGSGVQRGAKLVKYLLRDGWRVQVVAIDPAEWPEQDRSLADEIAGCEVAAVRLTSIPGVEHRAARAVPGIRRAVRSAVRAEERRPDVALLTSPDLPWGVAAQELTAAGVPFVVDYPDPWTVLPDDFRVFTPTTWRSRLKWALAPQLERWVLARASAATFATEPIRAAYAAAFPAVRGTVVTNGYDPEDFAGPPPEPNARPVRIVHTGSFAGPRSPVAAARVTRAAVERAGIDAAAVVLVLVGAGAEQHRPALERELGAIGLELRGWVPHADAIAEIRGAGVLWLDAMVHLRTAATGKIYEYLASGRPIVGLAHAEAPATQLVAEAGAGRLADAEADAAIALADVLTAGAPAIEVSPELLRRSDRAALARITIGVLEEAIG